jgi:hypothetical protein
VDAVAKLRRKLSSHQRVNLELANVSIKVMAGQLMSL